MGRDHSIECEICGISYGGMLSDDIICPDCGETPATIAAWADETFGKPVSNLSIAVRAMVELKELILCLEEDDHHPKAAEELADVRIVLVRLERICDIQKEIDRKMKINRGRKWVLDGSGHGQHE